MNTLRILFVISTELVITTLLIAQTTVGPFTFYPTNQGGTMHGQVQIDGYPAVTGDIIAAFDPDGECVGAAQLTIYNGDAYINFVIYGDDGDGHGLNSGEAFILKSYDASAGTVITYSAALTGWQNTNFAPIAGFDNPGIVYNFISPTLAVFPLTLDVTANAGTTSFSITSNVTWTVSESVSWLSVSPINGSNNGTIVVTYDQNIEEARSGIINVSALNVSTVFVTILQDFASKQTLIIPVGWSGISTYILPVNNAIESMFEPIVDEMVILQNTSGIYWPGQNVNTIGFWNPKLGAQIKMYNQAQLEIIGIPATDNTINIGPVWYYLPVLSQCNVASASVFEPLGNNLKIVKDIAGSRIYWPEFGIFTLNTLEPGKAYFIKMNIPETITYQSCSKSEPFEPNAYRNENLTPWNSPSYSVNSHIIAVTKSVCQSIMSPGDYIAVFTNEGICSGFSPYMDESIGLVAFGDDPTTTEKDGFSENEIIKLRVYNLESKKESDLSVAWDPSLTQKDGLFYTNGLSAIKEMEVCISGSQSISSNGILIYPNPAKDQLNIIIPEIGGQIIEITGTNGQLIYLGELLSQHSKIDISQFRKGVYFVKICSEKWNHVQKVVKD